MSAPAAVRRAVEQLTDGGWHRLHWASPLLKGGIAFIAILAFVLANLRERLVELVIGQTGGPGGSGGDGGQGGGGGGDAGRNFNGDPISAIYETGFTGIAILIVIGVLLLAVALFAVAWRMHTFRIGADAVEVRSGVVFRHNRQARLDRIQGIHITRPLFARLFGAARIELNVAGQDAKVELSYLGSRQVDELRRELLRRASGVQRAEAEAAVATAATASTTAPQSERAREAGILNRRVHELLGPELDPDTAPPESVVKITPLRLIGSLVVSEFTLVLLLVVAALFFSTFVLHRYFILFLLLPSVLGSLGYYVRRFSKAARYSIAATSDGVRVGFGLLSTSNDTLPPGRIHAIEVTQPILWRPMGWWMIRINRAGHASGRGSSSAPHTLLLPVGRLSDVEKVLALLLPGLAGADTQGLVMEGLVARGRAATGFSRAPRRAQWLRPFSWSRTGLARTGDAVLLRSGFFWRRLTVLPLARLQSVRVAQGPVRRMLDLAELHFNTIAGPVRAELGVIDRRAAVAVFTEVSAAAVAAARADSTHRWAS
ncbi:MAG: putative rane protein [Subtercola sp.]|nr:putative rane protein [Subtercola sp.]